MATLTQLPGARWFFWLRNCSLRIGVLIGIYLSCILIAWLWVANRIPKFDSLANMRNVAAAAACLLVMTIPVLRFRREPGKIFISGVTAWSLLTLAYMAMETHFSLLESRWSALQVFMLGVISYGLVAALDWVFSLCAETRHRHVAEVPHVAVSSARHRAH